MAETLFCVVVYRMDIMTKCIHKDICDEYNRRFNKKLYKSCDRKCRYFKSVNDYAANMASSLNDTLVDYLFQGHTDREIKSKHFRNVEEYEDGRI